jgi:predicted amidohydrolase
MPTPKITGHLAMPLATALALAACAGSPSQQVAPANQPNPAGSPVPPVLVRADGSYPVKALEKDSIVVKVVQNGVKNLQDFDTVAHGLQENLSIMVEWAERACSQAPAPDFILFNEFPLTGYSSGSRDEKLQFTIEVPGPETDRLGEVAKACDSYIIFGSYARDPEWPRHILSINTVIDRNGDIAATFWKPRSVKRLNPGTEIPTTTVENVRDRFRARYGIEQEFPVLMTEYGNIAVSTVQLDPLVYVAFGMRGVEIMFRTSTLFSKVDVQATALFNDFYSAMSNITFPPDVDWAHMGGGSLIVDPDGRVLAEDPGNNESIITAEIPIAQFRADRRIPRYPLEVVQPVFEQFVDEVPLNHLDLPPGEMPDSGADMKALMDSQSRWLNPQP